MNGSSSSPPPTVDAVNPFSPTAVAKVMEFDGVNVETAAVRQAIGIVRGYLESRPPGGSTNASPEGEVLAVIGDYGTGKTHLAMRVLKFVSNHSDGQVEYAYLEATADSFHALYNRFIEKLEQANLRARVHKYYSDIVADSLPDTPLNSEMAAMLRSDRIDPGFVVEQFDLSESALLRDLQQRLASVTDNQEFGTALSLLLRPGFEDAVWAWLEGKPPDRVLTERGVTTTIDTDVAALQAMGVITLLYSGNDNRFVLVIDELDKVLSAPQSQGTNALSAFKQLLHVFVGAGSLLILSCLPDILDLLGKDARDRIGHVVRMGPLNGLEARQLIEATQAVTFGTPRLAPFTQESVDYLVEISRGVARQIIRLCFSAYRRAMDTQSTDAQSTDPQQVDIQREVTIDVVRQAAGEQFDLVSLADVRAIVGDVLNRNGWAYTRDHRVGTSPASKVDFWITPGNPTSGCAVLVVGPVLDQEDVEKLRENAIAIRAGAPERETLLVVDGYLTAEWERQLGNSFGVHPLIYGGRSFTESLTTTINAMINRLRILAGGDPFSMVRERVEWINQQQSNTHTYIEQVGLHVDRLRSSSDRQLLALQRELSELTAVVRAGAEPVSGGRDEVLPTATPAEVDDIFVEVLDALDEFNRFDSLLRDAFGVGGELTKDTPQARNAIRAGLRFSDTASAAGTAVLLQKTINSFRDGIHDWFRAYQADAQSAPNVDFRDRLDWLCGTYDAISEFLPPFQMTGIDNLVPDEQPAGDNDEQVDSVARAARRQYHVRVTEAVQNLSSRVRATVLRLATAKR